MMGRRMNKKEYLLLKSVVQDMRLGMNNIKNHDISAVNTHDSFRSEISMLNDNIKRLEALVERNKDNEQA